MDINLIRESSALVRSAEDTLAHAKIVRYEAERPIRDKLTEIWGEIIAEGSKSFHAGCPCDAVPLSVMLKRAREAMPEVNRLRIGTIFAEMPLKKVPGI